MLFAQMIFATWKQDFIKEKADEPFKGYVHHLQQHAAYLNDTNYHVDNLILHNAIEQMYAPALHNHIEVKECANDTETVAFLALSFKDWVAIVNCRDTQLKQKKKELATQVAALKRSAASTLGEPSRHYNTTPHLSSQHANQVTTHFPDTLKNVTAAVVLMSIVSTMDYDVGAIFPSASADALYANLSNGSNDSDYVPSDVVSPSVCAAIADPPSCPLPSIQHLIWDTVAFNANSSDMIPLRAMIDHSAPIVMISASIAERLQLHCCCLLRTGRQEERRVTGRVWKWENGVLYW
ncbi:hypothetical protein FISHEDRAFT_74893 [Fistulina hepatica ATCC 64428]|uniref:Uncharacterized protein n=1 Tax=Fistulina hepatica ATCC 64428 TaxID=1128425 RepID=A0A0D7A9Y3_9AGAR|nr:hypothetical protein FISHEDRAFT_74893 [Fistulina hepatica ATCC 64428]